MTQDSVYPDPQLPFDADVGIVSPPVKNITTKRFFFLNSFSSLILLLAKSITGIWFTNFLIGHLSLAVYGIVPLAISMTSYMSIVMTALNYAVGRYFTIDLRSGALPSAIRTFNTALWGTILCAILLAPLVLGFAYFSPWLFDIPHGFELEVQWLFGLVMLAYLSSIVRSIFSLSSFATNRLDLQNWGFLLELVVRISLTVLFFYFFTPSLLHVGIGTLIGTLLSFWLAIWVWKRLTPEIVIDIKTFEFQRLRPLLSTGGWIILTQAGNLLLLNIDLIVVNIILGIEAGGKYGSVLQWSLLLRTLAIAMSGVLKPMVLDMYARGKIEELHQMMVQSVRLFGLLLALPVGGLIAYANPLLTIWLGNSFGSLSLLLVLLVAHLAVNLAILPLFHLQLTLDKVRWMGVVTAVSGLANVILGIWWTNWLGMIGLALVGLVVFSIRNAFLTPIYSAHIMQRPWYTYLQPLLIVLLATILVSIISYLACLVYLPNTWFQLILAGGVVAFIYSLVAYLFLLTPQDKLLIKKFIPNQLRPIY